MRPAYKASSEPPTSSWICNVDPVAWAKRRNDVVVGALLPVSQRATMACDVPIQRATSAWDSLAR